MPCQDSLALERLARDGTLDRWRREEQAKLQKDLDDATRYRCETMTKLEAEGLLHICNDEELQWWESHKKFDAIRKARGED